MTLTPIQCLLLDYAVGFHLAVFGSIALMAKREYLQWMKLLGIRGERR